MMNTILGIFLGLQYEDLKTTIIFLKKYSLEWKFVP
jgi:hypothetical protein